MSNNQFPLGKVYSLSFLLRKHQIPNILKGSKENKNILAFKIQLKEKNKLYPLFPTRLDNKKVIFRNGYKTALVSIKELIYMKNHSESYEIFDILKIYISQDTTDFSDYFEALYDLRMKSTNEVDKYVIKILMNSTYGKFGQKPERTKRDMINITQDTKIDKLNIEVYNGIPFIIEKRIQKYQKANLLTACLTTNFARFKLHSILEICEKNNIIPYYCDTDSIIIPEKDSHIFSNIIGKGLGQLAKEYQASEFQAIDSKEYWFTENNKEKLKFKGMDKINLGGVKGMYDFYNNGGHNRRIPTPFNCIKRNLDTRTIEYYPREKRSYYSKRIINSDLTTKPINSTNFNIELIEIQNKIKIKGVING